MVSIESNANTAIKPKGELKSKEDLAKRVGLTDDFILISEKLLPGSLTLGVENFAGLDDSSVAKALPDKNVPIIIYERNLQEGINPTFDRLKRLGYTRVGLFIDEGLYIRGIPFTHPFETMSYHT